MIRTGHDPRPRIHVRSTERGATFSYGPTGMQHRAESLGAAVERAVASIEGREAVIIFEGASA
jgi:hypothetical protein